MCIRDRCTPADRSIRISSRLTDVPVWVLDYVLVHELAHLLEAGHGPTFRALIARYPLAERATGFLMAKGLDGDGDPDELPGDAVSALGLGPVEVEPDLRERDIGDFTGLTRPEIEVRWPGMVGSFIRTSPPGGETSDQVLQRALPALERLAASHPGQEVLVVSHGGVIRNVEHHLGGRAHPLPNLGGVRVDVVDGALRLGERVLLLDPDEVPVTVPHQL